MPRPFRLRLLVLAVAAVTTWSCGSSTTTSTPTTPTLPTVTTDVFSGTLNVNGAAVYPFLVLQSGTLTSTLTTVGPDPTSTIGMALGTWTGTVCQLVLPNENSTTGTVVSGKTTSAATLCVRVYDVGKITDSVSYTVTVVHP